MFDLDEEIQWAYHKEGLKLKTPKEKLCGHAFAFKITQNFSVNEPE